MFNYTKFMYAKFCACISLLDPCNNSWMSIIHSPLKSKEPKCEKVKQFAHGSTAK